MTCILLGLKANNSYLFIFYIFKVLFLKKEYATETIYGLKRLN